MFSEYICLLRTFSGHFLRFVRENDEHMFSESSVRTRT